MTYREGSDIFREVSHISSFECEPFQYCAVCHELGGYSVLVAKCHLACFPSCMRHQPGDVRGFQRIQRRICSMARLLPVI
jgi:hypothetical protein